jgi:hypothetical protein
MTTRAPSNSWTPAEDAQLTRAVTNTPKKKHKGDFTSDWFAISAQVPDRTSKQCNNRWLSILDLSTDRTTVRKGKWEEDEDIKLKAAVQTHGGRNWSAIAALVPGRTRIQCHNRWHDVLDPSINLANRRTGKWEEDEDIKLKNAVHKHGGKDWAAVASLVPGRTRRQCHTRWNEVLHPSVNPANGRTGKWNEDEDINLKNAVHKHGGKDWAAIAILVPGRTRNQCCNRWHDALDPSIHPTANRGTGKWIEDEDIELKDAVHKHGGKDWAAIAVLVPGRTQKQCQNRWYVLKRSIDPTNGRMCKWTTDEDIQLKNAVHKHAAKDWFAIAALVPGRTQNQCLHRWHRGLKSSINQMTGRNESG